MDSERPRPRYTALIDVTQNQNPYRAVKSVVDNIRHFCQVIFVKPDYDADRDAVHFYDEWKAHQNSLKNSGVPVVFVSNAENDAELEQWVCEKSAGVIELSAYVLITKPAFMRWIRHVHAEALASPEKTHFGLRPHLDWNEDDYASVGDLARGIYYGYFLVVLVCEWVWGLWERFKVAHRPHDVVLRLMICKGNDMRFLPRRHWKTRYLVNTQWDHIQYASAGGAVIRPPYAQRGASQVQAALYNHSHLKWGFWVFAYFVHFIYFCIPVWGLLWRILNGGFGLPNNVWVMSGMAVQWFFQLPVTLYVAYSRVQFPLLPLVALAYPVYVVSFPLVFIAWKLQHFSFQRHAAIEK